MLKARTSVDNMSRIVRTFFSSSRVLGQPENSIRNTIRLPRSSKRSDDTPFSSTLRRMTQQRIRFQNNHLLRCHSNNAFLSTSAPYSSPLSGMSQLLNLSNERRLFHSSSSRPNIIVEEVTSVLRSLYSSIPTSTITRSDLARILGPTLFSKVPKGFEKFFENEPQQDDIDKKPSTPADKRPDNDDPDKRGNGSGGPKGNGGGPASSQALLMFLAFLIFSAIWGYSADNPAVRSSGPNQITVQHFLNALLAKGYVQRIDVVNKELVRVVLRSDCPAEALPQHNGTFTFRIGSVDSFENKLEAFQSALGLHPANFVPVQHVQEVDLFAEFMSYLPTLAIVGVSLFLIRRLASVGAANDPNKFLKMGRANPVSGKDVKVKVKFSDVAGMTEAKQEIKEFVDFLKDPKKYQQLGAHIPKGALLVGPPGTGKTLLAKAVAGEANVPFFSMSGSDFIEVFVGVGPSRVRDLFQQARKHSPSIIFIDEIDAVGRKRAKGGFAGGSNDERENTLNQMLVEMDGFTPSTGVVVLAGTNRADILDPALTRPGRFDRTVAIEKPDLSERTEIFKVHLKPIKLDPQLDPAETNRRLAALTPGFVGADIQNVCNEAAIYAARRNALVVSIQDFESACERVLGGMKKSTGFINKDQRRTVAFHEAGHAVAGWFLKYGDPVLKVSIVPRTNGALGFAQNLPEEIQLLPRQQVLDKIAVLLGGRVSEELNIGRISTGASDDLDKVTKLAYAFVSVWGFNPKVGLMSFQNRDEAQYYKPYSEQLAQLIDSEVRDMINEQYARVKELLTEKSELLNQLSEKLLLQETITFNDIRNVLGERPYPLKAEYTQYVEATPMRPDNHNETPPHIEEQSVPSASDGGDGTSILTDLSGVTEPEGKKPENLDRFVYMTSVAI